jgi:hypothetical protein
MAFAIQLVFVLRVDFVRVDKHLPVLPVQRVHPKLGHCGLLCACFHPLPALSGHVRRLVFVSVLGYRAMLL